MEPRTIQDAEKVQMDTAHSELLKNFKCNETKSYRWRRDTLLHLRKLVKAAEPAIEKACRQDLKMSPYASYISNTGIALSTIDNVLQNLKEWLFN